MKWLFSWFFKLLYTLQKSICYLLDFVKDAFNKIVGIDNVNIDGKSQDILTYLTQSKAVKTAFFGVLIVGVILVVVFTIVAIIKSETQELGNKPSKGHILTESGHALLIFLVIPFVMVCAILLTNVVMQSINGAMSGALTSGGNSATIGGQILVTSGYDAYIGPAGKRGIIEGQFISGALDYNDIGIVQKYYDLSDINFFVGICGGLIILIMFAISALTLIQRIFDVLFLYITSPAIISTMPLDDGQKYRRWLQLLAAKLICGYAIVLSMNLFFMIIPLINRISFFNHSFKDGIVRLLFVTAGAFATTKSNFLIANLIGDVSAAEAGQQLFASMRTGGHFLKGAGRAIANGTGFLFGGSDYIRNKKKGAGMLDNISASIHSDRNRHTTTKSTDRNTGQKIGVVSRAATLPVGVAKDIVQGGLTTAGKNIKHRIDNVAHGTTYTNRADYYQSPETAKTQNQEQGDKTNAENIAKRKQDKN